MVAQPGQVGVRFGRWVVGGHLPSMRPEVIVMEQRSQRGHTMLGDLGGLQGNACVQITNPV